MVTRSGRGGERYTGSAFPMPSPAVFRSPYVQVLTTIAVGVVVGVRWPPAGPSPAATSAFGAMAFTAGRYGIGGQLSLGRPMAGVYITCLLFIVVVLGTILRIVGPAGSCAQLRPLTA